MGVNKNIEDLRKELADMHRLFDNIISDKKENAKKELKIRPKNIVDHTKPKKEVLSKTEIPTINTTKEEVKENTVINNIITKEINNSKKITEINNEEEITIIDQTKPELDTSDNTNTTKEIIEKKTDKSINNETEISDRSNPKTESEELSDIMISFDSPSKSKEEKDSKVINLHTKEQYLSIREKLEKIKNEIKQKELELKKKKK